MKLRSPIAISVLVVSIILVGLLFNFWPGEEKFNQQHITSICCLGMATIIFLGGFSIDFQTKEENKWLRIMSAVFYVITFAGVLILASLTEVVAFIIMFTGLFSIIYLLLFNDLYLKSIEKFKA